MPKLDVSVGDEFPAREVREDSEEPVVHHHHYYRRRRPPGRWLWFVGWVLFISFVFRTLDYAFGPPGGAWNVGWGWGGWGHGYGGGWRSLEGTLMGLLIIAGLIWTSRCRRRDDERDADRRDRDGR